MTDKEYLKELINKIKQAQELLLKNPEVRSIEVKDSNGNSAKVVSPFLHING